ncbi:hypothetical protein RB614_13855 [Phytohabitans sp. ZYX-F-186]|uniref:DUF222 domain-containing protein n=1 Tax=Phytohabitans maris TaxID=3071409 RepID=A0ABU0ZGL7_9ACTN|nr:hypothetical protein [Phytohabitans sp. ZYX-F-186]MDQ7905601.1 hypothetical protein [Phytohabitans sp. ZYX-F-186]
MSSLLHALAYRIQEVGEELPVGQVATAADRLRTANGLLAWVMRASATTAPPPALTAAGEHLDHAAGALLAAREALAGYLVSIGLPRDAVPPPDRDWHAALAPAAARRPPANAGPPALTHFWSDRVDELTERSGSRPERGAESTVDLLHRCARTVPDEDRARLRRELAAVDPAVGLALSAVAPAPLRFLAAEMLGHPPSKEDLSRVREALLPRVRKLLPAVDDVVVDELLARACHAPPPQREEGERTHPVDAAVTAAVLVGVLLRVTGREPDELAAVTEELRRAGEREEKERRG